MRRLALLGLVALLLLPVGHAHAEPFLASTALDQRILADVTATAFAFMAPRTLEPIALAQLTLWGLRGLASLDPALILELRDGAVRVLVMTAPAPRLLLSRPVPDSDDPGLWGGLVADLIQAAWDGSQAVRRVGTDGVIEVFFDSICNHLDPYSRYATPEEARADYEQRDRTATVGLDVASDLDGYVVAAVAPEGPAAEAGVRVGDRLLSIDGEDLDGATPQDVTALLDGAEATNVVLELRSRRGRTRTVVLARAVLVPATVEARRVGALLMVRISGFAADTGARLAKALADAGSGRKAPRGVVLDLRGNRGGLLREAVAAAETLLARGVVTVTVGRDPTANHEFRADGADLAHGLPVVVLVDGRSASAAEILAAALADQHRAVVVGSSTLGKGLVQAVEPLPNEGELLLTWSRVLAPLGWPLQGLGVLPQICTSLGEAATTAQLSALSTGDLLLRDILGRDRAARPPLSSSDTLQIRAACPAAEGSNADLSAARFLVEHPAAYAAALLGPAPD